MDENDLQYYWKRAEKNLTVGMGFELDFNRKSGACGEW